MAVTQNLYTGNGSTVLYSFTFPYLETTDIKVSVNGTNTTAYTLANATTIQFNTAPVNGAAIRIYRQTDDTALPATFYSGSAIRANDLNENFTQNLYVTQESTNNAATATSTANTALTNSNTAISTANGAVSTANTASTNASAAVATANTASTNASAAVSTANTASTNATAAVNTANTASTNASNAVTTANTALSTANTASSNASAAVATANTASSNASAAVSTANTASSNATTAVNTANTALSTANAATATANTASTNATAALNAVASSLQYVLVANVAGIPSSPANNYAIEVADSTGIESFSPLANRPAGFVGDVGLSVRMQYSTTGPTWNWLNYFPNNAETRYLKLAGGTLTGQLRADDSTSVASPVIAFDGDTNTGIAHTGADELALVTGGTARLTVDPSGNVAVSGGLTKGGNNVVTVGDTGTVTSTMIADGTIVNADVNASAAIAGTKVSPDFGAQNVTTTGTSTAASFTPTSSTVPTNGLYLPSAGSVAISTNGTGRLFVNNLGDIETVGSSNWNFAGLAIRRTSSNTADSKVISFLLDGDTRNNTNLYSNVNFVLRTDSAPTTGSTSSGLNAGLEITSPATIRFGTNGSERLRITSAGLVGIGTSVPQGLVSLSKGTGNTAPTTVTAANSFINIGISEYGAASNGKYMVSYGYSSGATNAPAYIGLEQTSTGSYTCGDLTFYTRSVTTDTAPTERLRITNAGNVGIGTTSASSLLHLSVPSDGVDGTKGVRITNPAGTAVMLECGVYGDSFIGTTSNSAFSIRTNNTERCRLDTSGRILVGTSSTSNNIRFLVQGSPSYSGGVVQIANSGSTPANGDDLGVIQFSDSNHTTSARILVQRDAGTWTSNTSMPTRLVFSTTADGASSPTERMRIQSTGKTTIFAASGQNVIGVHTASAAGTTDYAFYVGSSATSTTAFSATNLGIFTNGNVVNTNNSYGAISDLKLKENIVDANSQWDDLKALQVRKYNFKEGQTHTQIGLVAQEVELVSPGLVTESPDRDAEGNDLGTVTKSVNYSVLYMKAVKALQEAMERIEQLETSNADLLARVTALESA